MEERKRDNKSKISDPDQAYTYYVRSATPPSASYI